MTDTTETPDSRATPGSTDARTRIERYDPASIEPRWQARWDELGLYDTDLDDTKNRYYLLTMYPYPSGDIHIGHWYIMTPTDAIARFQRMHGKNVFLPIGFDAFGLPAENAAIKQTVNPRDWTMHNVDNMRRQLRQMGATFDWDSEVVTCDPDYYRWNQWFFLQFLRPGSPTARTRRSTSARTTARSRASRSRAPIAAAGAAARRSRSATSTSGTCASRSTPTSCSTSPRSSSRTRSGSCRRTGSGGRRAARSSSSPRRPSTSRAARRSACSRPGRTRCSGRRSWSSRRSIRWSPTLTAPDRGPRSTRTSRGRAIETEIERLSTDREKTGVAIGADAINPVNGERIPIFIADYVLATYGTGAIMAVPAHDERDFEFARKFGLPIRQVVAAAGRRPADALAEALRRPRR